MARKKDGSKKLILLLALLVVVGGAVMFIPSEDATATTTQSEEISKDQEIENSTIVKADSDAPDFTVEMIDGTQITLSQLRGKIVLINFWATWCPPCREELKRVQTDLIDRFEGRDFVFLPISRGEKSETVETFLKDNGYTFPVGLDIDQSIFNLYASNYIPRNFLINRHGVVLDATVGYDPAEFEALVKHIEMSLNAR